MKKKQRYYTFVHYPGYGREDHLADDLIARAVRQLGGDTSHLVAQHLGLLSHAVPTNSLEVRLPAQRGVAARMRGALRRARREYPHRAYGPDCAVVVELVEEGQ